MWLLHLFIGYPTDFVMDFVTAKMTYFVSPHSMSSTVLNIGLGGLAKLFVKTLGLNVSSRFPLSLNQFQNLALKKKVISCSLHGHREGQLESRVCFQSSTGEILSLAFSSTQ